MPRVCVKQHNHERIRVRVSNFDGGFVFQGPVSSCLKFFFSMVFLTRFLEAYGVNFLEHAW